VQFNISQFGGFSSDSLAERMVDCKAKLLVTADGVWRGDKLLHLKEICDAGNLRDPNKIKLVMFLNISKIQLMHKAVFLQGATLYDVCELVNIFHL
jgi:acyl-coenzyme A synthetase/AMP-(fatty) acid ligase